MNNRHLLTAAFEGEELPVGPSHEALSDLLRLADGIQRGELDATEHKAAAAALEVLRNNVEEATPTLIHRLASTGNLNARALLELQKAVEAARPIRVASWGNEKPKDRDWLVEDWLPSGRVTMLTGEGGAGKSRLALQLAVGLAAGGDRRAWLEAPPQVLRLGKSVPADGVPVVFASWEDEPNEFYRRLFQISGSAAPWVTPDRVSNLKIASMMGEGPVWAPTPGSHISASAELTVTGRRLRRLCEQFDAMLLILDPLAAAYASHENTRGLVRAFVSDWDDWGQANDCAVLLLAHPPKSSQYTYAGSTD